MTSALTGAIFALITSFYSANDTIQKAVAYEICEQGPKQYGPLTKADADAFIAITARLQEAYQLTKGSDMELWAVRSTFCHAASER